MAPPTTTTSTPSTLPAGAAPPAGRPADPDREILRHLTRFGALTATQVGQRLGVTPRTAARRLDALAGAGDVQPHHPLYRGPTVYLPTTAGARRAGTALPAPRFTPLTLTHHLAVADLAEALLRHYPGARWITERELRRDTLRHPPRPTSHHSTGHLEGSGHVPDGVLIWHDHHVAVELELTPKGPESYARILRWYAAALAYRRVVWFCADPALLRRLSAILERERVADFIAVKPLPAGLTLTTWG